ncbi:MAG: elongation factor Ts [Parcubacteria group bacterium CG_4_10_14_0_8_um_filter_35_7]|nr:MAG: elongation factor Ts [Parcubacteria group bacterium CG23_combo_of_CG06-09_8_20_14_all_35_9]PIY78479.1 MAG: elongation factor Ts [Parcubacteria group bacterium CG_4_10_14_0_8_um_filter_35_7]
MLDTKIITKLRTQTGAGIVDCKKALEEAGGDTEKAKTILRKKGQKIASSKENRETAEGLIGVYIHLNGKVGAMIEVHSETDFVARNPEFKELIHDLAMQVAATNPLYLSPEDVPEKAKEKEREIFREELKDKGKPANIIEKIVEGKMNRYYEETCLLKQPFIKDDKITIEKLLEEKIAKIKENIKIVKFVRYEI